MSRLRDVAPFGVRCPPPGRVKAAQDHNYSSDIGNHHRGAGRPGSANLTTAFCVAIAATPSIPTNTAIPLSGFGKAPNPAPKPRKHASNTTCRTRQFSPRDRCWLSNERQRYPPNTTLNIGIKQGPISPKLPVNVMSKKDDQVTGDVGGEQSAEREKTDHVNRACCHT